ncbi:MAG: ubiquinol-cytochrome c reductase iron-sulfur subunit [Anaerolineaceae bacterium]|jgi:Rieske Fe-S protein|nr:MAG: ubiquinol-cytochrome c reductase iron-sulfur subunit [Anaerolineaceae bacterium]
MTQNISRRDFIKVTTGIVGGLIGLAIGLPIVAYLLSPSLRTSEDNSTIDLGPLEKFPVGIPTKFEFTRTKVNGWERTATNYGLYVVRRINNEVRVFSDICTHLGCRVSWHPNQEHYISPCHDGHFDLLGNVVSGPPPRPLDEFVTHIENGNLIVSLPPFKRNN